MTINFSVKPHERVGVDVGECHSGVVQVTIDEGVLALLFADGQTLITAAGNWQHVQVERDPAYVAPEPVVEPPAIIGEDLLTLPEEPEDGWWDADTTAAWRRTYFEWISSGVEDYEPLFAALLDVGVEVDRKIVRNEGADAEITRHIAHLRPEQV